MNERALLVGSSQPEDPVTPGNQGDIGLIKQPHGPTCLGLIRTGCSAGKMSGRKIDQGR